MIIILVIFAIRFMIPNDENPSTVQYNEEANEASNQQTTSQQSTSQPTINETVDISQFEKAFVTRVVDGDTIWVELSGESKKIRFIGVNTPEKGEDMYQEATDYTTEMLLEQTIYLEKDISDVDQYGRLLRYIWLELPTADTDEEKRMKLFNSMLLEEKLAEIVVYKPDTKYLEYYHRLMD
jgi:micrococcal nuclease